MPSVWWIRQNLQSNVLKYLFYSHYNKLLNLLFFLVQSNFTEIISIQVWQNRGPNIFLKKEIHLHDRLLSLDIDPSGSIICTGTGGHSGVPPSHLFDLETYNYALQ